MGKDLGAVCFSLTGNVGGRLKEISHYNLNVNHSITARVQEIHILIGHLICSYIDNVYSEEK